jgi:hypothetical protein
MVDLKTVKASKTSADRAKIAIEAIKEAEKIFQSKKGKITKTQFAEMLFPGIETTPVKTAIAPTIAVDSTGTGEIVQEAAPHWVHALVDWLWDIFV